MLSLSIKEFKVISSNKNWDINLVKTDMNETIFKIVNITDFSLYTENRPYSSNSKQDDSNIEDLRKCLLPSNFYFLYF